MIRFSIVITTYNRLNLLKRSIASALEQTLPCEVVVVDNASTDGTQAYVAELIQSGHPLIYQRNDANLGHSGAVNVGVDRATGDWIKLVDDDDYLAATCIESMAQAIALHPAAVICSCQAAQVDANGKELSRTRQTGPGQAFYIPQADIHYGMLLECVPFGTPIQVAFRRDAFLQSGGWDTGMTLYVCDDIDSWIKIAQFGDAIFLNQCLTYRTVWAGGLNRQSSWQERLNVNVQIKEKIHALVSEEHQANVPTIAHIREYLKLHWGLVALKQKAIAPAFSLGFPAMLSPTAWQLLLKARQQNDTNPSIRREVLITSLANERSEAVTAHH